MKPWAVPQALPDGRLVECIDMTLVERVGDHWVIDVHFDVDGEYVVKRIELDWAAGAVE